MKTNNAEFSLNILKHSAEFRLSVLDYPGSSLTLLHAGVWT